MCTRVSRRRKCRVAGAHKIEEELLAVEVAATSGYVTAVSIPNLRERGTFVVAVQHAVHGSGRANPLHLAIAEVKEEFFAVEVSLRNVHHQTGPTEAATVRRAYRLQTSHNGSITQRVSAEAGTTASSVSQGGDEKELGSLRFRYWRRCRRHLGCRPRRHRRWSNRKRTRESSSGRRMCRGRPRRSRRSRSRTRWCCTRARSAHWPASRSRRSRGSSAARSCSHDRRARKSWPRSKRRRKLRCSPKRSGSSAPCLKW